MDVRQRRMRDPETQTVHRTVVGDADLVELWCSPGFSLTAQWEFTDDPLTCIYCGGVESDVRRAR